MKNLSQWLAAVLVATCACVSAQTPTFGPGNLAVLRLGDGTQTLTSAGNTVFVDQYTTNGLLWTSTPLPDSGNTPLLVSGSASSEGGLTRSLDRTMLAISGYKTNRGALSTSLANSGGTVVPRGVATVDAFANYTLAQTNTTLYTSNNIRCATTDGTNGFWTAGATMGTIYLSGGNPPITNQSGIPNTRYVRALGGNLYFSTQAGTPGIYTFANGLPRTGVTASLFIGTGASSQIAAFDLNPALTVAYVADQRNSAGGIQKWVNNSGTWSLAYTFATGSGAFGLVADFSGAAPIIYATTGESSSNRLVMIVDTNSAAAVTMLATAGSARWFRGLDFVPDLRPVILTQPQSQVTTNGADVVFTVQATSPFALGYQWLRSGTNLSGANSSALTLHGVTAADQATYRVIVTNLYAAATSAEATLTVNTVLVAPTIATPPQPQTGPVGGSALFTVTAAGTPPLSYQWQLNASDLSGQTGSSLALTCLSPSDQGAYSVRITNVTGMITSQTAWLTVLAPAASSVAYTNAGAVYAQNFDSLPHPGLASVNADNPILIGTNVYGLAEPFDFAFPLIACGNGIGGLGLSNTMAGWYGMGDLAAKLGASAGDQSTGGIISYGLTNSPDASTNRALGLLATSSTGATTVGLKLINATPAPLTRITLQFTGELWRQAAVPKALETSYWIDATATNDLTTNLTATLTNLLVTFPANPAATNPVPVDGTLAANQIRLGVVNQAITNWPPGGALWLVWRMADATGKGQGLAIDDLTSSATAPPSVGTVSLAIQMAGTNVVLAWPAAASAGVLQTNADLTLPGGWGTLNQPWQVVGGSNTVTFPIGPGSLFFRLKQ